MTDIPEKKILILSADGFEQSELEVPRDRLRAMGAEVHVATPGGEDVRGWDKDDWGRKAPADLDIAAAKAADYDALVLPGGQINPDLLRTRPEAVQLVQAFEKAGKPIAAICHAPWLLVEAGLARGRRMTSYHSMKTDVANAGADWVDEEVVISKGIITSRSPGDLDAFVGAIAEALDGGAADTAA